VASGRVVTFLTAEELQQEDIQGEQDTGDIEVDGDFVWEPARPTEEEEKEKKKEEKAAKKEEDKTDQEQKSSKWWKKQPKKEPDVEAQTDEKGKANEPEEQPFELQGLKLRIPRGSFVALVGKIGSGKVCLYSLVHIVFDERS
jgi:ABC-type glutathione transport system ATPase component